MKPVVFLAKNSYADSSSLLNIIQGHFDIREVMPCSSVLAAMASIVPDLIIIDEPVSDQEAYNLCREIKFSDKYRFIPVVFTFSSSSPFDKVRFIESGADDYYFLPFDPEIINDYLNALINRRRNFAVLNEKDDNLKREKSGNMNIHPCLRPDDQEIFEATFQQSAVGIAQVSAKGYFQKVNTRFCEIVGYTKNELMSVNFRDLTYPDKRTGEDELISKTLSGEIDSYEVEKRYIHKNGFPVWVKLYSNVVRDDSGAVKYAIATVADISRQKKVESALYESESLFRTMYESSGIGIVRMSVNDKRIEQANAAFCNMLGYTEAELTGKLLREISYLEDLPANIYQQKKLMTGDINSIQMEKRYLHKDGHHVWGLLNANLIFDEQKNPLYFIGNVLDITESKNSQKALYESEKKYRTYVDNSPYPIFAVDSSGNFIDANPAGSRLTLYSAGELLKMNIRDLAPAESRDQVSMHLQIVKSEGSYSGELLFVKKDGTLFYMQVEAVKIDDNKFLALCADTTERKTTEKLLIEAKLLAEDASKSKSEFVANISHELRTPLNIVLGYSDILISESSGKLNEKQMKYATSVKDAGSHLLEIVDSLIYIAEIGSGDWQLHISRFSLLPVMENMKKVTRSLAQKKNISLEFDIKSGEDIISADEMKFKVILHNLIGNSLKFTPDNGSVRVVVRRSENEVAVSVVDTGIGIPEEEMGNLFDPFVQVDGSHTRKYSGVGIGLFLVKELIEMHGGSVNLQSRLGEGTTITFTIPQRK